MYKVVIDAGHGGKDNGATYEGRKEKDDVLEMAFLITNILFNCGIDTIMTRSNDTFVGLRERAEIANDIGADLFLSVHRNSSPEGNVDGVEVWINSKRPKKSEELANNVLDALLKSFDTSRGVNVGYRGDPNKDFAVNRLTNMPSALVEFGFINSDKDNKTFDENKEKIAQDVANAVLETLNTKCMPIKERTLIVKDGVWNVRAEPYGTVVGKVYAGQEYPYSSYKDNFYKIPMGYISEEGVILNDDTLRYNGNEYVKTMAQHKYYDEGHLDNYDDLIDDDNAVEDVFSEHYIKDIIENEMQQGNRESDNRVHCEYCDDFENEINCDLDCFIDNCCEWDICKGKKCGRVKKIESEHKEEKAMQTFKIKKGVWNVRKTPHDGEIVGIVYGYQVYFYEGTMQGWYKVNGGYISPVAINDTKKNRNVVTVKDGRWNVRKQPHLHSEITKVIGGKQMLEYYKLEQDFYFIDGGYLHKNCIM